MGVLSSPAARAWGLAALVAAACFLGARADVVFQFPGIGAAIVFPPYAILTAALWRSRPGIWWMLLLAASAGNFLPHRHSGAPISFVLMTEAANHLRALIAAMGLRAFGGRSKRFDTLRTMVAYLVFAVALAPGLGALAGASVVTWHRTFHPFWLIWQEWALSNALTALMFMPLFMIDQGVLRGVLRGRPRMPTRHVVEGALLLVALLAVGAGVFLGSYKGSSVYPARLYWPLPFLLWTAVRFGPRWTSAALLAVASLSIWGSLESRGPFVSGTPLDNLLELQLFLLAVSVPLLLLSSVLAEQKRIAAALAKADDERRELAAQRSVEMALREADRRKDEFIAMMGHELRNPLASIAVSLEVLRRATPPTRDATWATEAIGRQLHHLTRLVDDLLDVARITHGKIRLHPGPVDLGTVVANAVDVTRPLMVARSHALTVEVPDRPLRLEGDAVRLTQVVGNLLHNAAKYTESGGRVRISLFADPGGARIAVRDSGVGIAPESLGKIFELFTQLPSRPKSASGGLGVGLALARRLVEMHGGRLAAASAGEGQGSEFTIHLPLPAQDAVVERSAMPRPLHPRTARRVLIGDDNVDAAEGLRHLLEMQDHVVEVVHDGAQVLEAVSRREPDVVLLDIGLPIVDGLEVARQLRQRYGRQRPLLVAISGLGRVEDMRRSTDAGFDHHLVKPIDLPSLEELLATETAAHPPAAGR